MSPRGPLTLPPTRPRNPVALRACQRRAGAHRKSASALRQKADRELSRELRSNFSRATPE